MQSEDQVWTVAMFPRIAVNGTVQLSNSSSPIVIDGGQGYREMSWGR